jgi:hypothetical protein
MLGRIASFRHARNMGRTAGRRKSRRVYPDRDLFGLKRDGFRLNRHRALDLWWSMIFSENRHPFFRIML